MEQKVESLLCYRVGWENEPHAQSIVKQLLSGLQMRGESNVQNLVTAVTSQGATSTDCSYHPCYVLEKGSTVEKTEFGGEDPHIYPHVASVRMWRWPDARWNELIHTYENEVQKHLHKYTHIMPVECVNPYHYRRIHLLSMSGAPICGFSEPAAKTQPSKTPNETTKESSFHEAVSSVEAQNLETPTTNATLSQTLPKDLFSLSCFQSANVAPPSLTASTMLGASSISNGNDATSVPSTSCSQDQANVSNTVGCEAVSEGGTKLKTESDIPQGFTVLPDLVGGSSPSNDDYYFKTSSSSSSESSSSSSDDGFEVIDYDEEMIEVAADAKSKQVEHSEKCSIDSDQVAKNESTAIKTAVKTESDFTSLMNWISAGEKTPDPSSLSPTSSKQLDEIMKKYDELHDKHERLKSAFIEVCYATTYETSAKRTEKVQNVMINLDDIFRYRSGIDKEYTSLKLFIVKNGVNSNDSGTSNDSSPASASSSPTCAPYRRKNLTSVMRRKSNPITSPLKLRLGSFISGIYDVSRTRAVQRLVEQRSTSNPQSPATNDVHITASGREVLSQQPEKVEPVTSETPSYPVLDSNINNSSSEVSCDQNIDELKEELYRLRTRVKSLNEQLEIQKRDELEKMMLYTNNMREQYITTVQRLKHEKEALSEKLAADELELQELRESLDSFKVSSLLDEKDKEIAALNDNLLALSAILTSNDEEILALKNEKRNLKRNSDAEEPAQEISLKRRASSECKAESNEDPITPQHVFEYLCAELEKSNLEKSETSPQIEATSKDDVPPNNVQTEEGAEPSSESPETKTLAASFELCQISDKEQAMTAKLNEMVAELEVMKINHVKTKFDLEARLKNGAKQYAKLYVKYDKLIKNSQLQN